MRIEIEIPKEFEEHFKKDKFEDSLNRLYADVHLLAGNYERELAEMLIKAFRESKPAYSVDKVVEELESKICTIDEDDVEIAIRNKHFRTAIEIVKQGGVSDDVCEWKKSKDYPFDWSIGCDGCEVNHRQGDYCPRCGKKIRIVSD